MAVSDNPFAKYAPNPVQYQAPNVQPDIARTQAQTQEITQPLPYKVSTARSEAVTKYVEASQAPAQQAATTQQKQADATKAAFQAAQEQLTLQHQRAQIKMFGEGINKTMDAVNQAEALIVQNPGQFSPGTYQIMRHVPGTAANKVEALIDPENGPLASNQVLNTVNTFRDESGTNPGGGGNPPRIFRSEIPLFAAQAGALDPGRMGAAATLHTLDNMEFYGKRANAMVNGADPDDPAAIKQYGIPETPTLATAQAKLNTPFNPNTMEVKFNDEGKPGQLTPQQQAQEQAYLKANPHASPEDFSKFLSGVVGKPVANGADILNAYNQGRGLNSVVDPDPRAVALAQQRLAQTNSGNNFNVTRNGGAAAIEGGLSAIPFHNQIGGLIDTVGNGQPYSVNRDANFLYDDAMAKQFPLPYFGGQLAGGTAILGGGAGLGSKLLRMGGEGGPAQAILDAATNNPKTATSFGDMVYGGATNVGQNPDSPVTAGIEGTAAGLGGNIIGRGFQGLGGKALSAAGQRLHDVGINVPIWPKLLPGGASRVADQNQQFNAEAFNQAANLVGGDGKGAPTLADLKALGQAAYKNALDPVTGFPLSPDGQTSVTSAYNAANGVRNDAARRFALDSLNQHVADNFNTGGMTGQNFQGAYRGLSNDIGGADNLANQGARPSDINTVKTALGQAQDGVVGSLQAVDPDAFDKFLNANNLWRHMNVIGKAQDSARNSVDETGTPVFTAPQLSNASSQNARSYTGIMSAAQGDRPFNGLLNDMNYAGAKAGGSGIWSSIGHSTLPTLALLAGAGGGAAEGGEEGAGIGALTLAALAASFGSRPGQAVLRRGLLAAPNVFTAGAVPFTPNLNSGAR